MPFCPVTLADVTPACAGDAAPGLPWQAGMVAVRVADVAWPAGPGLRKSGRSALAVAGAGKIRTGMWWCSASRWRSRRRWCAVTGGCRLKGIRRITSALAWPRRGWTPWPAGRA